MALAVYGKHPAKGDFLEYGIPVALRGQLESWLDAVLAEARHSLADGWEKVWATRRPLRFWLGAAIWGEPVCGVMVPSVDRVGRRFPLVIFATGAEAAAQPCPAVAPEQDWYEALEAHLLRMQQVQTLGEPAALVATAPRLMAAVGNDELTADFWAVRQGQDLAGLWTDVALADHSRASLTRSYWWSLGEPVAEDSALPEIPPASELASDDLSAVADADDVALNPLPSEESFAAADAGADAQTWDLPLEAAEDSPFSDSAAGFGMFAAPEAAGPITEQAQPAAVLTPTAELAAPPKWSQLWAAEGLPSGHVLAWFLRGYDGNQ